MHAVDWFPTIAAITGFVSNDELHWDGINQWPALSGRDAANTERQVYIAMKGGQCLHQGEWKLIRKGNAIELFHLSEDPYEQKECSKENTAVVNRMRSALDAQLARDNPTVPEALLGHHP